MIKLYLIVDKILITLLSKKSTDIPFFTDTLRHILTMTDITDKLRKVMAFLLTVLGNKEKY